MKPCLVISDELDQRRELGDAKIMKNQFENAGADVIAHLLATGHDLHQHEIVHHPRLAHTERHMTWTKRIP